MCAVCMHSCVRATIIYSTHEHIHDCIHIFKKTHPRAHARIRTQAFHAATDSTFLQVASCKHIVEFDWLTHNVKAPEMGVQGM